MTEFKQTATLHTRTTAMALASALSLSGCTGVEPRDYASTEPEFILEDYFDGHVQAWGLFQGRNGEVKRRLHVTIEGSLNNGILRLDERFRYADGETDRRVWRIRRIDEHHYEGRADDIVGVAHGERYGHALNWRYNLALELGGEIWELAFDDWMYLLDDGVMVNRAQVSKFGIVVGAVTLFFRREDS